MITYLKQGKSDADVAEADAKVRATVEDILEAITKRGDDAVKELALKFDGYAPDDFRLNEAEIEAAIANVATDDIDDIKFAQAQVRNFAEKQKVVAAASHNSDNRLAPQPRHHATQTQNSTSDILLHRRRSLRLEAGADQAARRR